MQFPLSFFSEMLLITKDGKYLTYFIFKSAILKIYIQQFIITPALVCVSFYLLLDFPSLPVCPFSSFRLLLPFFS